jgi:hypothetical protein
MKAVNPEVMKDVVAFLNQTGDYAEKDVSEKLTAARKKKHVERSFYEVYLVALYGYFAMVANEVKSSSTQ